MADLQSSISLRDNFTNVLKKIDSGLKSTVSSMEGMKSKVSGFGGGFKTMASKAQSAVSSMNSKIGTGFNQMVSKAQSSNSRIIQLFGNFGNRISSSFSNAGFGFASFNAKLKNSMSNGINSVKNFASRTKSILGNVKNSFKQFGSDLNNGFSKIGSGANKTAGGFKSMVAAIGVTKAIGAGFNAVKAGASTMYQELNESGLAWKTFEGNMSMMGKPKKEIASVKSELQDFATKTIYNASDMASTYSQLAAVGTKNTTKLVKGFGGLAAASEDPTQAMKTLSQQATQMAAKPEVQWQDFKLMLEQTPAGISAIAKTMGKSTNQLVKDVQEGKIATQDFFDAVAKTGTNDAFTKMATQFKSIGQAFDGLKEGLANKLEPVFSKFTDWGIEKVSALSDKLESIDIAGKLSSLVSKATPYIDIIKNSFNNIKGPISDAAGAIKDSIEKITGSFGSAKNIGGFEGFMNGVTDIITNIANFAKEHSDTIGKLITKLPELAAAFVGFKVVKGIGSTLLDFGSGLGTILGASKDLFKNLTGIGKAKGPKLPKTPKVPTTGGNGGFDPTQAFGGFSKFAKNAGTLALIYAGIKIVQELSRTLKQINEEVPTNIGSLATKLATLGVATAAVSAFIGVIGTLTKKNPASALAGVVMVAASAGLIMLAAEALKQLDAKVPANMGDVAKKMGSLAIAIGGMTAVVGVVGLIASSGVGTVALGVGLLAVAALALDMMLVAEAIKQFSDKVPANMGDVRGKIETMAEVIAEFTSASLGSALDLFKNFIGSLNIDVVTSGINKMVQLSEALKKLDAVETPPDISEKVQAITRGIEALGGSTLGELVGHVVQNLDFSVVNSTINKLTSIAKSFAKLESVEINVGIIEAKINNIKQAIETVSSSEGFFGKLGNMFSSGADSGMYSAVDSALGNMVKIANKLVSLQNIEFSQGIAISKINGIKTVLSELGTATIGDIFSGMIEAGSLSSANLAINNMIELANSINQLSSIDVQLETALVNINKIKQVISALQGMGGGGEQGTPALGGMVSAFTGIISGLNSLSVATTSASSSLTSFQSTFNSTMSVVSSSGQAAFQAFVSAVTAGMSQATASVASGKAQMVAQFSGMNAEMFSAGQFAMQGLASGIEAGASSAVAAATSVANQVSAAVRSAMDIHSPSRVMMKIGGFVTEGFANGILKMQSLVTKASDMLVSPVLNTENSTLATDTGDFNRMQASISPQNYSNTKKISPQINITLNGTGNVEQDAYTVAHKVADIIMDVFDSSVD